MEQRKQQEYAEENWMQITFAAKSENEGFARTAVAAFVSSLDPTIEELADIKTAVSEAVTNCIIHGYNQRGGTIWMEGTLTGRKLRVSITDEGRGIKDIKQALEPLFTTRPDLERSGMGFSFMEAFMDTVEVESAPGKGTRVYMEKDIRTLHMEQVLEYIKRAHQGDKAARDLLVQNNLGLVWSIVRRFSNRGYDPEDLFQVGSIGLLKAIDRFDTDYEVKFSTYAVPLIIGEIRRYLRDDGMLKVSRTLKEAAWKVSRAVTEWQNEYGRDPTLEELSGKTGMPPEEIIQSLEANTDVDSLHRPVSGNEGKELTLGEQIRDQKNLIEQQVDHIFLEQLLDTLESEERQLIRLRYVEEKTQSEVAKLLGTTQVQISRREKKLLAKLRNTV